MKDLRLTESGLKWLKVNICSEFGLDKLKFDEQVKWVDEHNSELEELTKQAGSPFMYYNAVKALREHEKGNEVHIVIPMDASNQALQLYGVLTADLRTSEIASLGSYNNRMDAYQMLANAMNKAMNTEFFTRNICKKPLMVTLYGHSMAFLELAENMNKEELEYYNTELLPLTDENGVPVVETAFFEAMYEIAPNAMKAMDLIQSLNDKNIGTYRWTLPDGFKVRYDVKSKVKFKTEIFGVELEGEYEDYRPSEKNKGMAPNVIHSVDGYVAREMIRRMGDEFIHTIHDSFSVHPNNVDKLRQNYKDILSEILESDLLSDILTQIKGSKVTVKKEGTLTKDLIQKSEYALA